MSGFLKRLAVPAVGVALLSSFSLRSAQASSLPYNISGGSISDGTTDYNGLGSALATTGEENYTLKDFFNTTVGQGTVKESVYSDASNKFGAGDLTFVVSIDSVTMGDVGRITLSDFSNASGFDISATGSGSAATSVELISSGHGVEIDFTGGIQVGGKSETFILQTNAQSFSPGSLGILDTGGAQVAGFGVAPLPATASTGLVLLGGLGALAGVNALRRRRQTA